MSRTYTTEPGKRFQVVLRKKDARHGIAEKQFFEDESAANDFVDANEIKYNCEFIDLAYFKAV